MAGRRANSDWFFASHGRATVTREGSPLLAVTHICTTVCSMGIMLTKRHHMDGFWLGFGVSVLAYGLSLAATPASSQNLPSAAPPAEFTRLAEKLAADRDAG